MSSELDDGVLVNVLRKAVALCGYYLISLTYNLIFHIIFWLQFVTIAHLDPVSYLSGDRTLIRASRLGHVSVVRCLLKCRKTASNVESFQKFILTRNWKKKTAFDVAVEKGHVEVAKQLLESLSLECLVSKRNDKGKLLVSQLYYPEHDDLILGIFFDKATNAVINSLANTSITIPIQESPQAYTNSIMDPKSYPRSHKHELRDSLEKLDQGILELTPNMNTVLHLVSHIGGIEYAQQILEKHPSLIYHRNFEGETPAYIAAREGHVDILAIMISHFKTKNDDIESHLRRSTDNHTALHIAIQNHHVGVVFWLIKEVPQLANLVNNFNESPIYLAAERRYYHLLNHMLTKCQTKSFKGPQGKTALHAAAMSGSKECITYLLREEIDQKIQDERGWTPLRYAVHQNNASATAELVDADPSIVNEITKEDDINTFVVHIAASRGYCETLEVLMSHCPGCTELVDEKGKNILHVAVKNKKTEVIELLYQHASYTSLVNKTDNEGNTPIHLLMGSDLEMMDLVMDTRVNINAFNNEKLTPLDMASSDDIRKRLLEGITMGSKVNKKKWTLPPELVDNIIIVATLIATASFAAAFAIPGGFHGNEGSKQGTPILLRKAAFKAFMISNTLAFSYSLTAILLRIKMFIRDREKKHSNYIISRMWRCLLLAMHSMMVAFATATFAVLAPHLALAICLCTLTIVLPLISDFRIRHRFSV